MSSLDHEIIRHKLEGITLRLELLEPIAQLDSPAYLAADIWHRKGTERLLHEVIEAAVVGREGGRLDATHKQAPYSISPMVKLGLSDLQLVLCGQDAALMSHKARQLELTQINPPAQSGCVTQG